MSKYLFGFIGTGNMGAALARAAGKQLEPRQLILTDKDKDKARTLAEEMGCSFGSVEEVVKNSQYIFLGVKPQMMSELLQSISGILASRESGFTLVTMAAGVAIETIENRLGACYPIIRIMPNINASVGGGMILYCANEKVSDEVKKRFVEKMASAGKFDELPENLIDAGCAISGGGPAFVFMFIEALADGGVECGLPRDKALLYAAQTVLGSSKLILETDAHPGAMKDAVCSPGGTTIAGVHALENGSFRAACINAVAASFEKTKLLGKK